MMMGKRERMMIVVYDIAQWFLGGRIGSNRQGQSTTFVFIVRSSRRVILKDNKNATIYI